MESNNTAKVLSESLSHNPNNYENANNTTTASNGPGSLDALLSVCAQILGFLIFIVLIIILTSLYLVFAIVFLLLFLIIARRPLQFFWKVQRASVKVLDDAAKNETTTSTNNNTFGNGFVEPKETIQGDNSVRNWATASGTYRNILDDNNNVDDEATTLTLRFTRSPTVQSRNKTPLVLWQVSGHGKDRSISNGLLSNNGQIYWVEHHMTIPRRNVLVEGLLDYETHQLVHAFWTDSLGGSGTYPTLKRKTIIEEV